MYVTYVFNHGCGHYTDCCNLQCHFVALNINCRTVHLNVCAYEITVNFLIGTARIFDWGACEFSLSPYSPIQKGGKTPTFLVSTSEHLIW